MQNLPSEIQLDDVFTIENFVARYPAMFNGNTPEQKRNSVYLMLFKADTNGLAESGAIIGRHKSRRIVGSRFCDWLQSQIYRADQ